MISTASEHAHLRRKYPLKGRGNMAHELEDWCSKWLVVRLESRSVYIKLSGTVEELKSLITRETKEK